MSSTDIFILWRLCPRGFESHPRRQMWRYLRATPRVCRTLIAPRTTSPARSTTLTDFGTWFQRWRGSLTGLPVTGASRTNSGCPGCGPPSLWPRPHSQYRIDLMSVNGRISPKQCYYEMDYSFYSFYSLDSLEIWLDHNSTYYRSLSKNSDVKRRISHCDPKTSNIRHSPNFFPSHRRIFKTSLYYKTRLMLETRCYFYLTKYWPMLTQLTGCTWLHTKINSS